MSLSEGQLRAYLATRLDMYEEARLGWRAAENYRHPETKLESFVWPMLPLIHFLGGRIEHKQLAWHRTVWLERWPWAAKTIFYTEPNEVAIVRTAREVLGRAAR